jgi:hypothetical protein
MKLAEKISNHPLVEELYQDSDGYWANLIDGYVHNGACAIREDSLTRVWQALRHSVMTKEEYYKED